MASPADRRLRQEMADWIAAQPHIFDVAVCLHVPNGLRNAERGWDDIWLQKRLSDFLNHLDRKLLKSAHRRRKVKLPRIVTLEHNATVGWHVHALLASAKTGLSAERLCQIVKLSWHQYLKRYARCRFAQQLAWAEPCQGNHARYILKGLTQSSAGTRSVFDPKNTSI